MTEDIFSLSYHSRNQLEDLVADTGSEISKILKIARSRNSAASVTGALMFNEGRFTQVLEGPEDAVREIFASIQRDRRHTDVTIMSLDNKKLRRFDAWSMAFVGPSPAARAYYHDILHSHAIDAKRATNEALCQMMLRMISLEEGNIND